jgi:hypothetical protein
MRPVYPASSTASTRRSKASWGWEMGGAKPPSSPIPVAVFISSKFLPQSQNKRGYQREDHTRRTEFLGDNSLQRLISLGAHSYRLSNGCSSNGSNHDFLERHRVAGMYSPIQDIEKGDRHHVGIFEGPGFKT